MTKEEMLHSVRQQLTEERYRHTLGVVDCAVNLAEQYGADPRQAEVAAIFHDYAKYRDKEEMKNIILQQASIPNDLLVYHHELWHAPVGAYLVEREVGITDKGILDAIRYHTTGRAGMSTLEKVVCLADYIEPGRNFPGVEKIRTLSLDSLDQALTVALYNTIQFLEKQGQNVYPLTIEAYQYLAEELAKQ